MKKRSSKTAWIVGIALADAALLWLVVGCLGGQNELPLGSLCSSSAGCEAPLICLYGRCREVCTYDRDCPEGQACVGAPDTDLRACTYGDEGADETGACPDGLERVDDGPCREVCAIDDDCGEGRDCIEGVCVDAPGNDVDADVPGDADSSFDADASPPDADVPGDADSSLDADASPADADAPGDGDSPIDADSSLDADASPIEDADGPDGGDSDPNDADAWGDATAGDAESPADGDVEEISQVARSVFCGDSQCTVNESQTCCWDGGSQYTCEGSCPGDGFRIDCDGPQDCSGDETCCLNEATDIRCVHNTTGCEYVVCLMPDDDCGDFEGCTPYPELIPWPLGFCSPE